MREMVTVALAETKAVGDEETLENTVTVTLRVLEEDGVEDML